MSSSRILIWSARKRSRLKSVPTAIAVQADVTKADDCIAMVEAARGSFGKLDVIFANAGIGGEKVEFVRMPMEEWDRVIGVNLRGTALTCKAAAARLN